MKLLRVGDAAVRVDEEGYLLDRADWSEDLARALAADAGIANLTERHWKVLEFCRRFDEERGESPGIREISAGTGVPMRELYLLFPRGPGKLAARIAGLPKPKSCV